LLHFLLFFLPFPLPSPPLFPSSPSSPFSSLPRFLSHSFSFPNASSSSSRSSFSLSTSSTCYSSSAAASLFCVLPPPFLWRSCLLVLFTILLVRISSAILPYYSADIFSDTDDQTTQLHGIPLLASQCSLLSLFSGLNIARVLKELIQNPPLNMATVFSRHPNDNAGNNVVAPPASEVCLSRSFTSFSSSLF
ncbi:unnamed protein product, partial [Dibothriocephalus latus]